MFRDYGEEAFEIKKIGRNRDGIRVMFSPETLALRELHSLVSGILEDGKVTTSEVVSLSSWMEDHTDLQGNPPFDHIFNALDKVLEDGIITQEELDGLKDIFSNFVDPVQSRKCQDRITSIKGKHTRI